jgi:Xaa-Pro aminopeptidase
MNTHFPPQFFAQNRQKLYEQLSPGSFLVMTAWTAMQRSLDQSFTFEQEPNFWYLTGIDRPDWLLIVDIDERREWLVAPYVAAVHQLFDGALSPKEARATSGVERIISKREDDKLLKALSGSKEIAYTLKPEDLKFYDFQPNPAQQKLVRRLRGLQIEDVRTRLSRQRAIKQPLEVEALQGAVDATVVAIKSVVAKLSDLHAENEADALLTYEFRRQGVHHGFEQIVAAGQHTTTMHYASGNAKFGASDWLLLDIGARSNHYCADISRTLPLGNITDRQFEIYESLRGDQQRIIELMTPHKPIEAYFEEAEQILHDSQVRLGLLDAKSGRRDLYQNMPHAISHGLGYDVHDPLGSPEALLPGMVLTAEIGIYLWGDGFGVRLEDDILITDDGRRNLSAVLPTDLHELGVTRGILDHKE